jgi:hypothetical protein
VDIGARAAREALEEIAYQLGLQVSYMRRADFGIDDRGRAAAEIDCRQTESFIHGHDKVASPQNPTAVSQRTVKHLAKRNPEVFDCVVLVHVQVACRGDFQIEAAMPREKFQHVIKKTDPSRNLVFASTLNGERDANVSFRSLAN